MNRLKKYITIRKVLFLVLIMTAFFSLCGFTENEQRIYDYDDVFTSEEEQELQKLCTDVSKKIKTEIAIVTTKDYLGKTPMRFTDDFYDNHDMGYDKEKTGFILMFNMQERDIWISNAGSAPHYFTDEMINNMVNEIGSYLKNNDYMGAANWYVSYVQDEMWKTDYSVPAWVRIVKMPIVQLVIALIIAIVVITVLYSGRTSPVTTNSHTYLKGDSHRVLQEYDRYVRTTTVRRKIETNSNGSGGGSVHTSSSGRSHGGGGGKF